MTKKKRKKRKENGEKKKKDGECVRDNERGRKKERHFSSRSSENRQSKLIRTRDKVGICDESYKWVPEIAGYAAFQKLRVSPTLVISCLVAM